LASSTARVRAVNRRGSEKEKNLPNRSQARGVARGRGGLERSGHERLARDDAFQAPPVAVEAELVKVRQDHVGKRVEVTFELIRGLDLIQVYAGFLGLAVARDARAAVPHAEVRVAGFGLLGQRGHVQPVFIVQPGHRLGQRRERTVETFLACVAAPAGFEQRAEVIFRNPTRIRLWLVFSAHFRETRPAILPSPPLTPWEA